MYIDVKEANRKKQNLQRAKSALLIFALIIFGWLDYPLVRDLWIRSTHQLVAVETLEVHYPSALSLPFSGTVVNYTWEGIPYSKNVGQPLVVGSNQLIPPVKILVDPENPQVMILKKPYAGW
jgi:hypothetical protein